MFRAMRRAKQALTQEECVQLLQAQPRGVLAVHGEDGYPYALPLDHLYRQGKLYFHCAQQGHKLDAIRADARVSYCVMDEGYRIEGEWPLHIQSVIVFGTVRALPYNEETEEILRALGQKYNPDPADVEEEIRKYRNSVLLLELTIDHMTGKRVKES